MIRRAKIEDAARLAELGFLEYMEEKAFLVGLNFSFLSVLKDAINLLQNHYLGSVLVVEDDSIIVGFYSCRYAPSILDSNQVVCHEEGWYVLPEYRGRGHGMALRRETAKLALEKGVQFIKIGTAVTTPQGRTLMEKYERDGYIPFQLEAFKRLTQEDT